MTERDKPVLILSTVNLVIAASVIIVIYWTIAAVAAFAAYVSTGPLFVLLPIGLALSVVGIVLARRVDSRLKKISACVLNGSTLMLHLGVLAGSGWLFLGSTRVTYIVPENYMGDVFVVYNLPDGMSPESSFWGTTYRIPESGIFRSRSSIYRGLERDIYYRERADRSLERIRNYWPTTIDRTPENLADNRAIGVFFPRSGSMTTGSANCSVEYERFYVGTKAYLLSAYPEKDLSAYFAEHPVECSGTPANRPLQPAAEKRGG